MSTAAHSAALTVLSEEESLFRDAVRSFAQGEIRPRVQDMEQAREGRYIHPYYTAAVHLALGDDATAFKWLSRACEERDTWVAFLGVDPIWDPVRQDERFVRLLKTVGLG